MQDIKIFELFVFMSLPFWLLLLAEVVFLFYCISSKLNIPALVSFIACLLLLQFFGQIPIFQYIYNNSVTILLYVLLYVLLGAIWGILKWYLFALDNYYKYNELLDEFIAWKRTTGQVVTKNQLTSEQITEWKAYFNKNSRKSTYNELFGNYEYFSIEYKPSPTDYKETIINWIMLWPWSLLHTLLADFLFKIFKHIYNCIRGFLSKITNYVWKDVQDIGE